jgi:cobalt-zinc-cadmium efflux system membrane fusion protein
MSHTHRRIGAVLVTGIVIGLALGVAVSGRVAPLAAAWRQRVATTATPSPPDARAHPDPNVVTVDEEQAQGMKIEPVRLRAFRPERAAVGPIAFNEDRMTSIFAPFQGRIVRLVARPGDVLEPGSPLLVIDSPDLVQANADLVAASVAVRKARNQVALTESIATRKRLLYEAGAGAYQDLEQAESDHRNAEHDLNTAQGQLEAARNHMRIPFGKTDAEIARIEATHEVDRIAEIRSPLAGTVTARKVSPDQFVRADNTDPMFTVADVSSMWLVANVAEADIPLIRMGEEVAVEVMAYPGKVLRARVSYVGASVDPTVRRLTVRADVPNPGNILKPDMFATFRISTGVPSQSAAVPVGSVVREGDGTMSVWVTTDRRRLTRRTVTLGLQQDGFDQIVGGLRPGELVATDSALFLGNALTSAE